MTATIIISGLIVLMVAATIRKMYKDKKAGKSCSCGCGSCDGCAGKKA